MSEDFEWDDENISHIARHRVAPHECEEAMEDPYQSPAPVTDVDEERDAIVGLTAAGRLLVVCFTFRGDRIRVATARTANTREERLYWRRS